MGLSGKLIGAGLGYFLGGPLGAVLGGVIGHYVKDAPLGDGSEGADPRIRQQQQELYFVASLVGILTAMLKADGDVRPEEVQAVRRFFSERLGYRGESLDIVRDLTKRFLRHGVDLDSLCRDVAARADYPTRLLLVECLLEVGMSDGRMDAAEQAVFDRAVGLLGISAADLSGLLARSRPHRDFETLGVSRDASPEEIRSAYRELVKKYHPDRVTHLGEEFRELAHRRFLEVQEAYERIRAAGG